MFAPQVGGGIGLEQSSPKHQHHDGGKSAADSDKAEINDRPNKAGNTREVPRVLRVRIAHKFAASEVCESVIVFHLDFLKRPGRHMEEGLPESWPHRGES